MNWANCWRCDMSLDMPTLAEVFAGKQRCPKCGPVREITENDKWAVADDIQTKLDFLMKLAAEAGRVPE